MKNNGWGSNLNGLFKAASSNPKTAAILTAGTVLLGGRLIYSAFFKPSEDNSKIIGGGGGGGLRFIPEAQIYRRPKEEKNTRDNSEGQGFEVQWCEKLL